MKKQTKRGNISTLDAKRSTFYSADEFPDIGQSRRVLNFPGVNYVDVNHFQDKSAYAPARRLQAGKRRIPMLMWPDTTFSGEPSDDHLIEHLTRRDEALHEKDTPN